jgi:hypothetical protein
MSVYKDQQNFQRLIDENGVIQRNNNTEAAFQAMISLSKQHIMEANKVAGKGF